MILSIISAVGNNFEVGLDGHLPWYVPSDFAHFKKTTMNHTLIMGRKTFESHGTLPGRKIIVITRNKNYQKDGITVVHSLEEAIKKCIDEEEVFISGGAEIYKQALNECHKMYLSHIHFEGKADTFFPTIDFDKWKIESSTFFEKSERDEYDWTLKIYTKK